MTNRIFYITLIIVILLFSISGCEKNEAPQPDASMVLSFTSYQDIPGVTEEEIEAIEALKEECDSFIYGMPLSTEAFINENGEIRGFSALFCEWLSGIFGIRFVPAEYEWVDLLAGLEDGEVDFTGEMRATGERRATYYMTDAIAERVLKRYHLADTPLDDIAKSRPLRYALIEGSASTVIDYLEPGTYQMSYIDHIDQVHDELISGEIDAFIHSNSVEANFSEYSDMVFDDFFPMINSPISLTTQNAELAAIISVVQKALQTDGVRLYLNDLYKRGYTEYVNYVFLSRLTDEEKAYIRNNRTVKYAAETNRYPISFFNQIDGEWQGVAADTLKEVEALTGLSFQIVNDEKASWPQLLAMLENDEVSMVSELIPSIERKGRFLWPNNVVTTDHYALLSKVDYPIMSVNDVIYCKVGLLEGSAYAEMFKVWFPLHAGTTEYETIDKAIDALDRSEIDLIMASEGRLLYLTNYCERPDFKANIVFNTSFDSTFGLNINESVLCSIIDKSLAQIDTEAITGQWMHKTYDYRTKLAEAQRPWLIGASVLFLCVIGLLAVLVMLKSRERKRLEYQVEERTNELKVAFETLKTREEMINTLNEMSMRFLAQDDESFEEKMTVGVSFVADMMDLGGLSIWRDHASSDGSIHTSQIYRWDRDEGGTVPSRLDLIDVPLDVLTPHWSEILSGEIVLNGPVRLMKDPSVAFKHFNVVSAFLAPLMFNNEYWGFVIFEDLRNERYFDNNAVDVMRSAAFLCANAVMRSELDIKLNEAIHDANSAARAKGDFLSNMSHEIRTPLNAIIGMINIGKSTGDIEKIKYCLDRADSASKHLLSIINDILDMSKIEADKFELSFTNFDFERMLMNVTNVADVRAEEKQQNFIVNLNGDVPEFIVSDELRLSQVITNLLTNAIKFTPEKGTIALNIEKTEEYDDEVVLKITVVDNGIGISQEQQERLFTSFNQADAGITRKFGGTGLGLALSKRIVELMDGTIWLESEIGKGAKFIFTIKAKKSKGEAHIQLSEKIREEKFRALAVDDSEEVRKYFSDFMETHDLAFDVASGGPQAVYLMENSPEPYNVIFIDWQMPDMDGIELTKKIKAINEDNSVVLMVPVAEENIIENEALAAGVKCFLSKPLFPSMLIDTINECFGDGKSKSTPKEEELGKSRYDFSKHTILVAEDIEVNREIMSAILEESGITIDFAIDGEIAVSMFSENSEKYSLILMDVNMPKMDGYSATCTIRALETERAKAIPIIAMTANVFKEDIEKCLESGMNDHTGKPIDADALIKMLDKYLTRPEEAEKMKNVYALEYGVAWNESFLLGNALVDMQHQQLFKQVGELVQSCENGDSTAKLKELLDFLVEYTIHHFTDEEALQLEHGYPEYEKHKREHDSFKETIGELVQRFSESGSSDELGRDMSRIVVKWLVSHIQNEDKKIGGFINR